VPVTVTKESGSLDEIWAKASKGIAAAGVILNSHGHVLLVKHSYGPLNWELPGGAAERDESPPDIRPRSPRGDRPARQCGATNWRLLRAARSWP
jgi:8-oxo-dGTP pyrophosphatase MutT (NUDIX family)